jgi:hypothetical protein
MNPDVPRIGLVAQPVPDLLDGGVAPSCLPVYERVVVVVRVVVWKAL